MASLAAAFVVVGSATAQSSVSAKESEAQRVLAQIQAIDGQLGHAAEAYNLANLKLSRIEEDQRRNERLLKLARTNLGRAESALRARVVAIYTSEGDGGSTLEILLGATSLDDFLNRVETVDRVSEQDTRVLKEVLALRDATKRHRAELRRARAQQAQIVTQRAAQKASIERQLAERRQLLSSIRSEIAEIRARERERQRELERQARARAAAQAQPAAAAAAAPAREPVVGAAAATPEGVSVAPAARYGGVVGIAMQYLGIPYKWGGASPSTGFDCSGFIMYVYAKIGVSLPHNAAAQYGYGSPVSKGQLQPGDLVFFNGLGHNGIYIGGGQFIHAPRTGDVVKISSLSDSWYAATWYGARRL